VNPERDVKRAIGKRKSRNWIMMPLIDDYNRISSHYTSAIATANTNQIPGRKRKTKRTERKKIEKTINKLWDY
jgi:hypothetical protein